MSKRLSKRSLYRSYKNLVPNIFEEEVYFVSNIEIMLDQYWKWYRVFNRRKTFIDTYYEGKADRNHQIVMDEINDKLNVITNYIESIRSLSISYESDVDTDHIKADCYNDNIDCDDGNINTDYDIEHIKQKLKVSNESIDDIIKIYIDSNKALIDIKKMTDDNINTILLIITRTLRINTLQERLDNYNMKVHLIVSDMMKLSMTHIYNSIVLFLNDFFENKDPHKNKGLFGRFLVDIVDHILNNYKERNVNIKMINERFYLIGLSVKTIIDNLLKYNYCKKRYENLTLIKPDEIRILKSSIVRLLIDSINNIWFQYGESKIMIEDSIQLSYMNNSFNDISSVYDEYDNINDWVNLKLKLYKLRTDENTTTSIRRNVILEEELSICRQQVIDHMKNNSINYDLHRNKYLCLIKNIFKYSDTDKNTNMLNYTINILYIILKGTIKISNIIHFDTLQLHLNALICSRYTNKELYFIYMFIIKMKYNIKKSDECINKILTKEISNYTLTLYIRLRSIEHSISNPISSSNNISNINVSNDISNINVSNDISNINVSNDISNINVWCMDFFRINDFLGIHN